MCAVRYSTLVQLAALILTVSLSYSVGHAIMGAYGSTLRGANLALLSGYLIGRGAGALAADFISWIGRRWPPAV